MSGNEPTTERPTKQVMLTVRKKDYDRWLKLCRDWEDRNGSSRWSVFKWMVDLAEANLPKLR